MKEKIYFFCGTVALGIGASMIHYGLGIMLVGALLLLGSYIEFEKRMEDNSDD